MKKLFIIVLLSILLRPDIAYANGAGLPSFFEINGEYTKPNPLQLFNITSQSFLLPQDFAPENYVVNQPIDFQIDTSILSSVISQDLLSNTTFIWDYGDGTTRETGLKHSHTYTHIGSYILSLSVNISTGQDQQPTQFLDSYLLNILPSKDYKGLPHAVILLNGQQVDSEASGKSIDVNLTYPISFDASSSTSSVPITQYLWNFGDGQTGTNPKMEHAYNQKGQPVYSFAVVVLRVKDKNGFINDSFAGLYNNIHATNNPTTSSQGISNNVSAFVLGIICLALIIAIFWRNRKHVRK